MHKKVHGMVYASVAIVFLAVVLVGSYLMRPPTPQEPQPNVNLPDTQSAGSTLQISDFPESSELAVAQSSVEEEMEIIRLDDDDSIDMPIITLTEEQKQQASAEILNPQRVDPASIDMPIIPVEDGVYEMTPEGLQKVEEPAAE